jgi:hypothetical protein
MRYITICQELLETEYPTLHERLRREGRLLRALRGYAMDLKGAHVAWMMELRRMGPARGPDQSASEALELAIEHLRGSLPCEPWPDDGLFSPDEAMSHARRATPSA